MARLPVPRLLQVTIATIAVLLVVKSGVLLQTVLAGGRHPDSAMVAAANAAGTEKEHGKPLPAQSPPLSPPPPDARKQEPAHAAAAPGASPAGTAAEGAAPAGAAAPGQNSAASEGVPPISDSEKALLQELRQRRKDIDTRENTVAARESVLTAAEQKLTVRVNELQALQRKLEGLSVAQKQKEDAGWQAMVKLYEAMKPKEAAAIFNELSMPVVLQLMDRMKDTKAAALMAAMSPEKARDVTSELAQMKTGHDASPAPEPGPKPNPLGG